ncbi:protein-L-isoaspartate(D-aspartate) O-methyltransferase [Sphingomonas sp. MM-1]|uniref:protein-L-isoaspartate(D-aspartate) O-methyltransferase n=1 Tax=Sphingomonas sp. MM-1 TaxID=745310 RepID=UPI000A5AAC68|nr:protein-L-isoaspartate(D-aspartate) O-methyltransferase [Sphingomonas sp. MM-1]
MNDTSGPRRAMVDNQIIARGISDPRVIDAMLQVPRELFVPEAARALAYSDQPLAIGEGQTISQPYIVALMIEAAAIGPEDHVLEIGAGSGYAAAVMGRIAHTVHAVERLPALARAAGERMRALGIDNVTIIAADGTRGWRAHAPYDAILVPAAAAALPPELPDQLAARGRLVLPLGPASQQRLIRLTRREDGGLAEADLGDVRFVPLIAADG